MLVLKIVLSAIIIAGSFYGGLSYAHTLKARRDNLKELVGAISEMENCILAAGVPVNTLYKRLSGKTDVGEMFSFMVKSEEKNTYKLWAAALEKITLNTDDKKPLLELAKELGRAGTQHQKAQLDMCIESLIKQLEKAEERYNRDGTLCRKIGIYGGILIVLFLI